jgi:hypothetical protein
VRHVALASPDDLDRADVSALIDAALALAARSIDDSAELIIQSVSPKQRPRR